MGLFRGGNALGKGVERVVHEGVLVLDEEFFDLDDAGFGSELVMEFLEAFAVALHGLFCPVGRRWVWFWGSHP